MTTSHIITMGDASKVDGFCCIPLYKMAAAKVATEYNRINLVMVINFPSYFHIKSEEEIDNILKGHSSFDDNEFYGYHDPAILHLFRSVLERKYGKKQRSDVSNKVIYANFVYNICKQIWDQVTLPCLNPYISFECVEGGINTHSLASKLLMKSDIHEFFQCIDIENLSPKLDFRSIFDVIDVMGSTDAVYLDLNGPLSMMYDFESNSEQIIEKLIKRLVNVYVTGCVQSDKKTHEYSSDANIMRCASINSIASPGGYFSFLSKLDSTKSKIYTVSRNAIESSYDFGEDNTDSFFEMRNHLKSILDHSPTLEGMFKVYYLHRDNRKQIPGLVAAIKLVTDLLCNMQCNCTCTGSDTWNYVTKTLVIDNVYGISILSPIGSSVEKALNLYTQNVLQPLTRRLKNETSIEACNAESNILESSDLQLWSLNVEDISVDIALGKQYIGNIIDVIMESKSSTVRQICETIMCADYAYGPDVAVYCLSNLDGGNSFLNGKFEEDLRNFERKNGIITRIRDTNKHAIISLASHVDNPRSTVKQQYDALKLKTMHPDHVILIGGYQNFQSIQFLDDLLIVKNKSIDRTFDLPWHMWDGNILELALDMHSFWGTKGRNTYQWLYSCELQGSNPTFDKLYMNEDGLDRRNGKWNKTLQKAFDSCTNSIDRISMIFRKTNGMTHMIDKLCDEVLTYFKHMPDLCKQLCNDVDGVNVRKRSTLASLIFMIMGRSWVFDKSQEDVHILKNKTSELDLNGLSMEYRRSCHVVASFRHGEKLGIVSRTGVPHNLIHDGYESSSRMVCDGSHLDDTILHVEQEKIRILDSLQSSFEGNHKERAFVEMLKHIEQTQFTDLHSILPFEGEEHMSRRHELVYYNIFAGQSKSCIPEWRHFRDKSDQGTLHACMSVIRETLGDKSFATLVIPSVNDRKTPYTFGTSYISSIKNRILVLFDHKIVDRLFEFDHKIICTDTSTSKSISLKADNNMLGYNLSYNCAKNHKKFYHVIPSNTIDNFTDPQSWLDHYLSELKRYSFSESQNRKKPTDVSFASHLNQEISKYLLKFLV